MVKKQKQTHRYREQTSGYQWGKRKGEGIKRYKLLCIKYISNQAIVYNTGNYSHYLVVTFNGV